jgi:hypothetical protein
MQPPCCQGLAGWSQGGTGEAAAPIRRASLFPERDGRPRPCPEMKCPGYIRCRRINPAGVVSAPRAGLHPAAASVARTLHVRAGPAAPKRPEAARDAAEDCRTPTPLQRLAHGDHFRYIPRAVGAPVRPDIPLPSVSNCLAMGRRCRAISSRAWAGFVPAFIILEIRGGPGAYRDRIDAGSAPITAKGSLSALYLPCGPTGTAP